MIKQEQYTHFFKILGYRFIAGGDYNAKHPHGEVQDQTYLLQKRKIPDVIDFCVTKDISKYYSKIEQCLDLTSDHSSLIVTIST